MSALAGKRIFLGVCGGIASYKIVEVARQMTRQGALVDVAMTQSATKFVGPLTFETLTRRKVLLDALALDERSEIAHVEIGKSADLIVVAPATCNMIARLAHGLAEDPISVTVLASPARVLVVPAMDHHMWGNQATQANLQTLRERHFEILPPVRGELASGAVGWGRLPEPEAILQAIEACLEPFQLAGKRIVVTAGGTQEPIDPVRYVGNRSSGKMGIAVTEEARRRGAEVTLVHASVSVPLPTGVRAVHAPTAAEMAAAVRAHAQQADALIMAAAVADFRPEAAAGRKIKKTGQHLVLPLVPTTDILSELRDLPLVKVGFAAETEDLVANARQKLAAKALDLVVANNVLEKGSGFGGDTNRVTIVARDGSLEELPLLTKREVAARILDRLTALLA